MIFGQHTHLRSGGLFTSLRVVDQTQDDGVHEPKAVNIDMPKVCWSELEAKEVGEGPVMHSIILCG